MTQNGLTSIRPDFYSAASESVQLLITFYAAADCSYHGREVAV